MSIRVGPALARASLDRAADRRKDGDWLAKARATGRLLIVDDERRAAVDDDGGLLLVDLSSYDGQRGGQSGGQSGPGQLDGQLATGEAADPWFLGVDADGVAYFGAVGTPPRALGSRLLPIREIGALLSDRDAGLYVTAVALANWHSTHRRCPRCGEPTRVVDGGWVRRCPADGSEHFPRTDPAVIVLLHDGGDRCLLGRQPSWPRGRYSTLAGFVEPGESLEQAVAREVLEESGVAIDDITYRGSQPWPFPASLMLGYEARVVDGEAAVADDELEDVRWFTRDELRSGTPMLPPPASIAHWLITGWLARA